MKKARRMKSNKVPGPNRIINRNTLHTIYGQTKFSFYTGVNGLWMLSVSCSPQNSSGAVTTEMIRIIHNSHLRHLASLYEKYKNVFRRKYIGGKYDG